MLIEVQKGRSSQADGLKLKSRSRVRIQSFSRTYGSYISIVRSPRPLSKKKEVLQAERPGNIERPSICSASVLFERLYTPSKRTLASRQKNTGKPRGF
ncbi:MULTISPECIES: hypothetical protein [unclassified Microcoleus]|uniref:hypothetical protein n=1 Tax=unclassified Microcoleus TaxID=2642155 RepID=UPI002FD6C240